MDPLLGGNIVTVYRGNDYPPELGGIIGQMVEDAAERTGLASAAAEIVEVAEVTWSDGSLGCGEPGLMYAQVVTDGMRVILRLGDQLFDYRASGVDAWFLCRQGAAVASSTTGTGAGDTADSGDKSTPGLYEITEDGVVQVEPPVFDDRAPTEGTNPPDE